MRFKPPSDLRKMLTLDAATTSSPVGPAATASDGTPFTHDENNQTGVIAGGVMGALVGLALIAGLTFFFRRRFRSRRQASKTISTSAKSPNSSYIKHELPSDSDKTRSYVYSAPVEVDGRCRRPVSKAPLPPPKDWVEMEA